MDSIEGNKIIAEFDGVTIGKDKIYKYERNGQQWSKEGLKYHSSWDWLMPVIEKIEKDTEFIVSIMGLNCRIYSDPEVEEYEVEAQEDTKIEATWIAVVEFIKWFNNQNK